MRRLIRIQYIERLYKMDQSGHFRCPHNHIRITPPCCSPFVLYGLIECGCQGGYTLYCPDCMGQDLTEEDMDYLVARAEVDCGI